MASAGLRMVRRRFFAVWDYDRAITLGAEMDGDDGEGLTFGLLAIMLLTFSLPILLQL